MGRGSTLLLVEMLHSGSIRKCSGIVTVRQPAVEMSLFVLNVFFEDIKVSRLLSGPFLFLSFGGYVVSCLTRARHDNEGVCVFKRWSGGE